MNGRLPVGLTTSELVARIHSTVPYLRHMDERDFARLLKDWRKEGIVCSGGGAWQLTAQGRELAELVCSLDPAELV